MLDQWARKLYRLCWGAAVVILVSLALYASLGRHYVAYLADYQDQIVNHIETASGLEVSLGQLRGSWSGLSPLLHIDQLELRAGGAPALTLKQAQLKLGLLSGLANRRFEITELEVQQLSVHLRELERAGNWHFAGIALGGGGEADTLIDSLLGVRKAQFANTQVQLHYLAWSESEAAGQLPTTFAAERVRYAGDRDFRRLHATLRIDQSQPTELLAEARGDPRAADFRADLYLRLRDSRFATLAPLFGELSELADGSASGELWLQLRPGGEAELTGSLDIARFAVGAFWGQPEQVLSDFRVEFGGRYQQRRWQFRFPHLQAHWQGEDVEFDGLRVVQTSRQPGRLQLTLPRVDAAYSLQLLRKSGLLSESLREQLDELAPEGELRQLQVSIPLASTDLDHLRVQAELHDVAVQPWHGAPGARGVNGYLDAGAHSGTVYLDSPELALRFPGIYAEALDLQQLRAAVAWRLADDRIYVDSGPIAARDGEATLGALLSLDLPRGGSGEAPLMTLAVGIRDGAASLQSKYVPLTLSDGLRDWLNDSLRGGSVREGAFIYRGSLRPDEHLDRSVQLFFDVAGGELAYHPDWPALSGAEAMVLIDDGAVVVTSDSARIMDDTSVERAHVTVRNGQLKVAAQVRGSVADGLRLLRESPLRNAVGAAFDRWRGAGEVAAQMRLDIPLAGGEPVVEVQTDINARRVSLPDYRLTFTEVRGPLSYSSRSGLNSKRLRGNFYGKPLQIRVSQGPGKPVLVDVDGKLAAADLRDWLQQPALDFVSGVAPFKVQITAAAEGARLYGRSSLEGMAIELPAPLGKSAAEPRSLILQLPLGESAPQLQLFIRDMGRFALQFGEQGGFGGAVVTLGDGASAPMQRGVFQLGGSVQQAVLEEWQGVLQRYLRASEQYASGGAPVELRLRELNVAELQAFGQQLSQCVISADNGDEGSGPWRVQLASDLMAGTLTLPEGPEAVPAVVLQRLSLPAPNAAVDTDADAEAPKESLLAAVDPRALGNIDIDIDRLQVGGEDWGQLGFNLRSSAQGASFRSLRGELRGVRIDGAGFPTELVWSRNDSGDETAFKGRLAVADIGNVLQRWQFAPLLESDSGTFDMNLYWEGAPDALSPEQLQGYIAMQMSNGRFLRASDAAAGTLRMVSIFNFANILRRLQLDFRDVFRKGIHYDDIVGTMHFGNGLMQFREPLAVNGPSSRFQLGGTLDFGSGLTDMELIATLPIGSNLPWIAALVSGLPAAAGVFIASKLFEEQMNKYSSAVYSVTGPWQEPELKFRRIFGDKLSVNTEPRTQPAADALAGGPAAEPAR